ncbi:hypothetical protein [Pseudomonas sp. Root401]|uniref:hypothetical protein n=1 Tax=Pseudomonas sp. Root401 TaxID=1736526 RepID=UPI00070AFF0E|nr:hypothetical protein [Pseudomonas sp. Root401]KQW13127.1 hypothetical protein ASC85_30440 [Pseudomonas sp. Root401]
MTKERLKNVGITPEVWKELKLMTIEHDCTMTEAVADLLKIAREQKENDRAAKPAGRTRKKPGDEPG